MAQGAQLYIWRLDARLVPIPVFKSAEQVKENAACMAFGPLQPEEMLQVQQIEAEHNQ